MYFVLVRKSGNRKTFILECEALKDNRENYAGILAVNSWDNLFSKEFVEKLGAIIVKLHRKGLNTKARWKNNLFHRLFLASWTLKILSFFLSFYTHVKFPLTTGVKMSMPTSISTVTSYMKPPIN